MLKEFRDFALKGNLIDMAVAFVMGAAFVKFSSALIEDLIMPFVGLAASGVDFTNLFIPLKSLPAGIVTLAEAKKANIPVVAYGNFVTISINFIIVAFAMFLVVKAIGNAKKLFEKDKAITEAMPAGPTPQEALLIEIRDLLKSKN